MKNKISKKLQKELIQYCGNNPITMDYRYDDKLSEEQINVIINNEDGLNEVEQDIWDENIDYIFELESFFIDYIIDEDFAEELKNIITIKDRNMVTEFLRDYIHVDINIKQLINNTGDLLCLIKIYSNYDCCNSFDNPREPDTYLSAVYNRVHAGVKRADFENEFYNGAYGGSLFCFLFECDIIELAELKKQIKIGEYINIPEGTDFGFFSTFHGGGSIFEKKTYRAMKLRIKGDTEFDTVGITADIEQTYSMTDVYGGMSASCQGITIS